MSASNQSTPPPPPPIPPCPKCHTTRDKLKGHRGRHNLKALVTKRKRGPPSVGGRPKKNTKHTTSNPPPDPPPLQRTQPARLSHRNCTHEIARTPPGDAPKNWAPHWIWDPCWIEGEFSEGLTVTILTGTIEGDVTIVKVPKHLVRAINYSDDQNGRDSSTSSSRQKYETN